MNHLRLRVIPRGMIMRQSSESGRTPRSLLVVIFLTGFSFLLYEVSWYRLLALVLGTTVTASTIVLAAFMAGFGFGAFFWGRIANRHAHVARLLAGLLAGIGVLSAVNYFVFAQGIPALYTSLASPDNASASSDLLVFPLAAFCLFIPAALMGGVFPLVSKLAIHDDDAIAPALGGLYALETLGGTLGGLSAGFVLLGTLGQMETVFLAVIVNVILAAWLAADRRPNAVGRATTDRGSAAAPGRAEPQTADSLKLRHAALFGTLVCGFAILGLQVLWIRMFRIYLTNTSYSFALVSSLVILGLFVGSATFRRRGPKITDYRRALFHVLVLLGVVIGLGLLLLVFLPEALMLPLQSVMTSPIARVLVLPIVASLLIVFPPSVLSGFALPLACRMYTTGAETISRDVGRVLLFNTFGTVSGPIVAAFLLLPAFGAALSVLLVVFVVGATALYIQPLTASGKRVPKSKRGTTWSGGLPRVALAGTLIVVLAVLVVRPEIRILPPSFSLVDRDILFYRESVEGTLSVGQDRDDPRHSRHTYVNNSAVIGSTYDAVKVVKMVGHFPFFSGTDCKTVLVIGFGIGVTTSAIASHPEVESIECVELVAGLKDAAVYYRDLNRDVVSDPRLTIMTGDGRHYLQRTSNTYDLISCDPTHPILGSGNLYTREYFELCREHLNPGGKVSQYLPLHKLRVEELMGIICTFHDVFPNGTVWLGHYHALLLGSLDPLVIDFTDWEARIGRTVEDEYFYAEPYHLAATLALDSRTIDSLSAAYRINSDDLTYTEFFAPACLDDDNLVKNLRFLMDHKANIESVFHNIPDPARMARFLSGNQLLTESLFARLSGDHRLSLQLLQQATMINPEDQEYPFLMKLYY